MKRTCFLLTITALVIIPGVLLSRRPDVSKPGATASLTVAPVIELDSASSMEVRIVLENPSKDPTKGTIKYLLANDSRIMADLDCGWRRQRKLIPLITDVPPLLSKERIREIKPGENVQPVWKLRDIYILRKLKPGRYEFDVCYRVRAGSVSHKEYGMTPLSFEQKLYLDIK